MLRSLLFVPGNSPNLIMNCDTLGADVVIFDLEDAVSIEEKDSARILVRNSIKKLGFQRIKVAVSINAVADDGFWKHDLDEIIPLSPDFIVLPKASSSEYVQSICHYVSGVESQSNIQDGTVKILALVENSLGVENSYAIASASKRVAGLCLGAEDLSADMRCARTKSGEEISYARGRLVSAACAAGIVAFDTPYTSINDLNGLDEDVRKAKTLGFSGKLSISPSHISTINRVFNPSEQELIYAQEVLSAIEQAQIMGKGAVALRGKMVDAPVVNRAKQILGLL